MSTVKVDKTSRIIPARWSEAEIEARKAFKCSEHSHNGLQHSKCYERANNIQERKGCIDIEAGALNADFDIMLSWSIKTVGKDEMWYDHLTPQDIKEGSYDARLIATCIETMWKYDRLIGHYIGPNRFDIPFIRSRYLWLKGRGMYVGPAFPEYGEMWITDTYSMSKRLLKITSRRQDSVANTIQGQDIKTRIDKDYWMAIKYGTPKARKEAIKYILDHNQKDVEQLENNYLIMLPFVNETRSSI